MLRTLLLLSFLAVSVQTAVSATGAAQTTPARAAIHGRVLDETRAPIAGARVTVVPGRQDSEPSPLSIVTDERGEFALTVEPGRYTIKAVADGFLEAL